MSVASHHIVVIRSQDRFWYKTMFVESFKDPWIRDVYDLFRNRPVFICHDTGLPREPLERIIEDIGEVSHRSPVICPTEGGEAAKSLENAVRIIKVMEDSNLKRDALAVAVGGGSIGDVTGFAASIWNRGIAWCVFPTTLLSQSDSAIGGKVGVNLHGIKNRIGTLHQPVGVICMLEWLDSLPDEEFRSGMGEIIKYGLGIDAYLWDTLEKNPAAILRRDRHLLRMVVHRCIVLKSWYVSVDEHDRGIRHVLNLGHTFGHALETACPDLKHGDAVALGLIAATRLAIALKEASPSLESSLVEMLNTFGFRTDISIESTESAVRALRVDKKHRTGEYTIILPVDAGRSIIRRDIPFTLIRESLESLCRPA